MYEAHISEPNQSHMTTKTFSKLYAYKISIHIKCASYHGIIKEIKTTQEGRKGEYLNTTPNQQLKCI